MNLIGEKIPPLLGRFLIHIGLHIKLFDKAIDIVHRRGIQRVNPQVRLCKEVIVEDMVFMRVAVDQYVHRLFLLNRFEFAFVAGRINYRPDLIINKNTVAMRILSAIYKFYIPFFEIEHVFLSFLNLLQQSHTVSGLLFSFHPY